MKPSTAVFTFSKPSPETTIASARIAVFVAETLKLPLYYDEQIADAHADTLIIVNGAFAFCKCLPAIGAAVARARRVFWVQNDYTIKPPAAVSGAESPFRKAFQVRKGESVHYLTTCRSSASCTPSSRYINWNSLTYQQLDYDKWRQARASATRDLFYYGAYRAHRERYFDQYFKDSPVPVSVSSTSKKFTERYGDNVVTYDGIPRSGFFTHLASHGLGLYIEDRKSHREFHSPANRFYEMLSAGLPMVFQPESVPMLQQAGFEVARYVFSKDDLPKAMRRRDQIAADQRDAWHADYVGDLRKALRKIAKEMQL